jgi:hypothetical protein
MPDPEFNRLYDGYETLLGAHVALLNELPKAYQEYLLTVYPYSLGDDVTADLNAVMEVSDGTTNKN